MATLSEDSPQGGIRRGNIVIFLTVGTYPLPFDRLIEAVDILKHKNVIVDEIFAQIGHSNYTPKYFTYARMMEKEAFDESLAAASALIGHAGMGTITLALEYMKPLLIMPRLKRYGEHVNDHQLGTARKFEELGHVLSAYKVEELSGKINELKFFIPAPRVSQAAQVADRIKFFLKECTGEK